MIFIYSTNYLESSTSLSPNDHFISKKQFVMLMPSPVSSAMKAAHLNLLKYDTNVYHLPVL